MAHRAEAALCCPVPDAGCQGLLKGTQHAQQLCRPCLAQLCPFEVTGSTWSFGLDGPTGANDLRTGLHLGGPGLAGGHTRLPLVVKGIMVGEDGRQAADHGARGVIVSNHGARYLDTTLATIEALPEVVEAVAGQAEVYLDGGIRRGTDVFKALALGARAVLIGRPIFWGLAVEGDRGADGVGDAARRVGRHDGHVRPHHRGQRGPRVPGGRLPLIGGVSPCRPVPLKEALICHDGPACWLARGRRHMCAHCGQAGLSRRNPVDYTFPYHDYCCMRTT